MDTSPLWLPLTLTAAVSFTAGVAVASLWWRHRCTRVHADEVERRVDIARRLYRLERGEPGGGKSRPPKPPPIEPDPRLDNYVLEGGKRKPRPPTPPIRPNPRLSNLIYEGGRPAGWAQKMIDAEERSPVDVSGRPLPPLPEDDVVEPWQKADRPKPPPGPDARLEPPQKRGITIKWVDPRTGYW